MRVVSKSYYEPVLREGAESQSHAGNVAQMADWLLLGGLMHGVVVVVWDWRTQIVLWEGDNSVIFQAHAYRMGGAIYTIAGPKDEQILLLDSEIDEMLRDRCVEPTKLIM